MKAALMLALMLPLTAANLPQPGYWVVATATAYCPCKMCCGPTAHGVTANGTKVAKVPYNLAADRSLPLGARVWIPHGVGVLDQVRKEARWFTVDDRGGALDTEARKYGVLRFDVRMKSHACAVRFGRQRIPVFISQG